MNRFKKNLESFYHKLAEVCENCGRNSSEISLIAVTKNRSVEEINELIKAGVGKIGENRLQEAVAKFPDLLGCEKHFIGSIQSNKAKEIAQNFDVVESVGSVKVAQILNEEAQKLGETLPIFLQVNLADEEQKSGFLKEELSEAVEEIQEFSNLKIEGFMVMGVAGDEQRTREVFSRAKELCEQHQLKNLSAGMSGDWQIAVEAGATYLRIGSLLFS